MWTPVANIKPVHSVRGSLGDARVMAEVHRSSGFFRANQQIGVGGTRDAEIAHADEPRENGFLALFLANVDSPWKAIARTYTRVFETSSAHIVCVSCLGFRRLHSHLTKHFADIVHTRNALAN
jgi:hypothetical protein